MVVDVVPQDVDGQSGEGENDREDDQWRGVLFSPEHGIPHRLANAVLKQEHEVEDDEQDVQAGEDPHLEGDGRPRRPADDLDYQHRGEDDFEQPARPVDPCLQPEDPQGDLDHEKPYEHVDELKPRAAQIEIARLLRAEEVPTEQDLADATERRPPEVGHEREQHRLLAGRPGLAGLGFPGVRAAQPHPPLRSTGTGTHRKFLGSGRPGEQGAARSLLRHEKPGRAGIGSRAGIVLGLTLIAVPLQARSP